MHNNIQVTGVVVLGKKKNKKPLPSLDMVINFSMYRNRQMHEG
jgi:hypothetical protein